MDEHIGYAVVEYSVADTIFFEDQEGKAQREKDACLKMIPRGRNAQS